MTLKIGSRSPKFNQLVPPSQQCICASLVKIRPSVQRITRGNEATRTQTLMQMPTGSAPKQYVLPPLWLGGHKNVEFTVLSIQCSCFTLMILSFRTDRSGQTVQTQIRLLLERVFTVCYSICIFLSKYPMICLLCLNFR